MVRQFGMAALALCALGAKAAAQGTLFTGLHADPLGSATLQIDQQSGFLVVANIGSSGQDGVRVAHPGFLGIDLEFGAPPVVPLGMRYDARAIGSIDGGAPQALVISQTESTPSGVELRTEFPAATSTAKRVEFRREGELLAAADGVMASHVASLVQQDSVSPFVLDVHYEAYICGTLPNGDPLYCFKERKTFRPYWNEPIFPTWAEVYFPWLPDSYLVDEVITFSDEVPGEVVLDHTDLILQNCPDVVVQAQGTVALDGRHVIGLDHGELTVLQQGGLQVSNIGASGLDGIAVALPDAESFLLELAGLPLASSLPLGARLQLEAIGLVGGTDCYLIGTMRLTKTPGPLAVDVSFAATTMLQVELLEQGNVVASASMPAGEVLRFGPWPSSCGITILGSPTGLMQWANAVQVTIPGNGTFLADEARVRALDANVAIAEIEHAHLTGKQLAALVLNAVQSQPVPVPVSYCTAKTNSLGCVPAIGFSGEPSLSIGGFQVTASNVINNKLGLMIVGFAQAAIPFQGGFLCIQPPTLRTPAQSSGGNAGADDCSGAFAFALTAAYANQIGAEPGDVVHAQYWYRDPHSPSTTGLTDALAIELRP